METAFELLSKNVIHRWIRVSLLPMSTLVIGFIVLLIDQYWGWENIIEKLITLFSKIENVVFLLFMVGIAFIYLMISRPLISRWIQGRWEGVPILYMFGAKAAERHYHHAIELENNFQKSNYEFEKCPVQDITARKILDTKRRQLEVRKRKYPSMDSKAVYQKRDFSATSIGNILGAGEKYPHERYGLDLSITWLPLNVSLPQEYRDALDESMTNLRAMTNLMFVVSTLAGLSTVVFLASGAFVKVIASIVITYGVFLLLRSGAIRYATLYSELLRSAYDIFRFDLYKALHLKPPHETGEKGEAEKQAGEFVNEFLWRGVEENLIYFHDETRSD